MFKLYQGYGEINYNIRSKHCPSFPSTQEEYEEALKNRIYQDESKGKVQSLVKRKNLLPTIIQLGDDDFGEFLDHNRAHTFKDITLIINDNYCMQANRALLIMTSQYFKNLLSGNFANSD